MELFVYIYTYGPFLLLFPCVLLQNSTLRTGQSFCSLPLPVKKWVQVNGFFEISSNLGGIWYGGEMDRSGKVRSIWNRLLLEVEKFVPVFMHMLYLVFEQISFFCWNVTHRTWLMMMLVKRPMICLYFL